MSSYEQDSTSRPGRSEFGDHEPTEGQELNTLAVTDFSETTAGEETQEETDQPKYVTRYGDYDADRKWQKPGYVNEFDLMASYSAVHAGLENHASHRELSDVLKPLIGQVNRILIIGFGSPENGRHGVFSQIALVRHAMRILEGGDSDRIGSINVMQLEPATTELDEKFFAILNIETLEFIHDDDERPDTYTLKVRDRDNELHELEEPSFPEKAIIDDVAKLITPSTLLVMPNLAFDLSLRYIRAISSGVAMIITNDISRLWSGWCLKDPTNGYVDEEQIALWGDEWKAEMQGWLTLRDKCQRIQLRKFTDFSKQHLWAYMPHRLRQGWAVRNEGLHLNVRESANALLEQYE